MQALLVAAKTQLVDMQQQKFQFGYFDRQEKTADITQMLQDIVVLCVKQVCNVCKASED